MEAILKENPPGGGLHISALAGTQDPETAGAFARLVYHNRNQKNDNVTT